MTVATCRGAVEKPGGRKTAYLWGNVQACPACLLQNHNYGAKGATKLTNQIVHGVEKAYFFYLYKMFKARLVRSEAPLLKNVSARYTLATFDSQSLSSTFFRPEQNLV